MKRHELKIVDPYIDDVWEKRKTFEVRKNDRDFNVGDLILLKEYIPESKSYGIRKLEVLITYLLDDSKYCKEDLVIIGFKEVCRSRG